MNSIEELKANNFVPVQQYRRLKELGCNDLELRNPGMTLENRRNDRGSGHDVKESSKR